MAEENDYASLTRRIAAIDKDIRLELDSERRFVLDERRADLVRQRANLEPVAEQLYHRNADESVDQMMDARILMTESTLRGMDAKMDKIIDQIHDMDTRHRLLEQQVGGIKVQMDDLRAQVVDVKDRVGATSSWGDPTLPREFIVVGALAMVISILLLILITWRVL